MVYRSIHSELFDVSAGRKKMNGACCDPTSAALLLLLNVLLPYSAS
jgi:hypothetical protein